MSLSLIKIFTGILAYVFNYATSPSIKIIFSPLNFFLLCILINVYVNEINETLHITSSMLYASFDLIYTTLRHFPNVSLFILLLTSIAILYYINFVNLEFRFKYPKLYNILSIICFILIFICIIF